MNHLIIIPTEFEAEMVAAKPRKGSYSCITNCSSCVKNECGDKVFLCISGIGKASCRSISRVMEKESITDVIVIGMAGNLTDENRLGRTYIIKNVTDESDGKELIKMAPSLFHGTEHLTHDGYATLVTVKKPVYTETRKKDLSKYADLVDMEGSYVAKLCKEHALALTMIRVVSDNCDTNLKVFFLNKLGIDKLPIQFSAAQRKIAEAVDAIVRLRYERTQR